MTAINPIGVGAKPSGPPAAGKTEGGRIIPAAGQAASPPPAGTSVASITSDQALASLIHATLEGGGDQGKVAVNWLKQFLAANPATAKSIQPVK
jgi:hypothetical protein